MTDHRTNKKKSSLHLICLGLLATMIVLVGCPRSSQFLREQQDSQYDSSYYQRSYSRPQSGKRDKNFGQPKKRMIVFDFWNSTPMKQGSFGTYAAEDLKAKLKRTRKVIFPDRIESRLLTKDFIEGDHIRVSQLLREGRRLGVAVVIIGKLNKISFRQEGEDIGLLRSKSSIATVNMEIKLFDVQGGREVSALSHTAESQVSNIAILDDAGLDEDSFRAELVQEAIGKTNEGLVHRIYQEMEKLDWQGRIAKRMGSKLYVNAGKESGLISGDILRVMKPGKEIYDPTSGAYLGTSKGQLKGTLEIVDFIGPDGAVGEIHTGGNFEEGDLVELY